MRRIVIHNHLTADAPEAVLRRNAYADSLEGSARQKITFSGEADRQGKKAQASQLLTEASELMRKAARVRAGKSDDAADAYFNTASKDPYQYVECQTAARTKQPNRPPYPEGSEASKMWIAGYRSVLLA